MDPDDAWARVKDPGDPTNWVLLTFREGSSTDMTVASGTGGLAEFRATLSNDAIHHGAFVVYGVDEQRAGGGGMGSGTSRKEAFVQVTWVGANVGAMAKTTMIGQREAAVAYFAGCHITFQITDGDRGLISEAELEKKLGQAEGAHKSTYYDYGGAAAKGGAEVPHTQPVRQTATESPSAEYNQ